MPGASGQGYTKLVNYDTVKLVHKGGLQTAFVQGTIFTMDLRAFTACISYFISTTAIVLLANYVFPDLIVGDTSTIDNFARNLNGIVPFVLGFYLSLALGRWWALRVAVLEGLFSSITNVLLLYSTLGCK